MRHIQVPEHGDAGVLELVESNPPTSTPGRLLVEVGAAGVNFIDTYHRTGLYKIDLPMTLGMEGAGRVVDVGEGAEDFQVGDVVAWADVSGSYAELASVPAERAVKVPDSVATEVAAAVMLQGLTAQYLATSTFPLQDGHRCLVHAGAGGVGRLLIQIAKEVGAEVFTTVGSPEKEDLAASAGADHVIRYREVPFEEAVVAIAGERPLDVVYDGVGAATFDAGLKLLRPRGMMVTFGNASGAVSPVAPLTLSTNGSLFMTRPTLGDYIRLRSELEARSADLFARITEGSLDVHIGLSLPLAEAADAHRALEGRMTTGKVLLTP